MTDNEIIKALECCRDAKSVFDCQDCPYIECTNKKGCLTELHEDALDLINRQKAEIERLIKANERFAKEFDSYYASVKSQAIKEFAEKLKEKAYLTGAVSITQELVVDVRDIDDLVEEMIDKQRKEDGKNGKATM